MKLVVETVNMRGGYQSTEAWTTKVVDEETGKTVGWVHNQRSPGSHAFRHISLFGGKYEAEFSSNDSVSECRAFAKGVEAVLNHLVGMPEESSLSSEPT
jgi:hypothetical protein